MDILYLQISTKQLSRIITFSSIKFFSSAFPPRNLSYQTLTACQGKQQRCSFWRYLQREAFKEKNEKTKDKKQKQKWKQNKNKKHKQTKLKTKTTKSTTNRTLLFTSSSRAFFWNHSVAPPKLRSQIHLTAWVPVQDIILFILKTAISEQCVFQAALMAV